MSPGDSAGCFLRVHNLHNLWCVGFTQLFFCICHLFSVRFKWWVRGFPPLIFPCTPHLPLNYGRAGLLSLIPQNCKNLPDVFEACRFLFLSAVSIIGHQESPTAIFCSICFFSFFQVCMKMRNKSCPALSSTQSNISKTLQSKLKGAEKLMTRGSLFPHGCCVTEKLFC